MDRPEAWPCGVADKHARVREIEHWQLPSEDGVGTVGVARVQEREGHALGRAEAERGGGDCTEHGWGRAVLDPGRKLAPWA
jgi:hypothetical protein